MENKKLNDLVVLPVMIKFNIDRQEAEARINLLKESGILQSGHPDDPDTQRMIDDFLSKDSKAAAAMVLWEKTVTSCMESKEFVSNYDRLSGSKMANTLRQINSGDASKKVLKEFEKFTDFVRDTVYARALNEQP